MRGTGVTDRDLCVEFFDSNALTFSEALASTFNASQEPGIMFELVVEPIILRAKSNQNARRPAVPRDDDLLGFRQAQVFGQVVFDFRQSYLFH